MRRCVRWSLLAGAALLGGCTGSASVVATVTIPPAMKCACVRVLAVAEDGTELSSQPLPRPPSGELRIAIFEPRGEPRPATLVARGYVGSGSGSGCAEPLLLNEESDPVAAEFKLGAGGTAALTLKPPPAAVDVDADLFRSARAGGPDCDDLRASSNPGASEGCGDGADDDCDGKVDCQDDTCLAAPCGGGRTCSPLGLCEGRESICADGLDDDLDGLIDCQDQDCAAAACDDRNPCTRQDVCAGGACAGAAVTCATPPASECLSSSGTCNPADGGCLYPPALGRTCGAGVCLHDAGCGAMFTYAPSNFTPPDAGEFVPLNVDCGTVTLNTDSTTSPWTFPGACGARPAPPLLIEPQTGAGDAVVVPVQSLTVAAGSELVVNGTRPAIFAVFGDAVIDGRIRMSPAGATFHGAGVLAGGCTTGQGQNGVMGGISAGGGGGGGFGDGGAPGGSGVGAAGGPAGGRAGTDALVPLAGGCAGGRGGTLGGGTGGNGGGGGGALQLSASGAIVIRAGGIGVPGGRGRGGQQHQTGGGGGGSGGAVLVEAQSLRMGFGGLLAANGGGGGAGDSCCLSGLADGTDGNDGDPYSTNRAGGGNRQFGGGGGGTGGQGGAGAGPPASGNSGTSWNPSTGITYSGGGGGGGGGVGRIRINVTTDCQLDGGRFSAMVTSNQAGDAGCP